MHTSTYTEKTVLMVTLDKSISQWLISLPLSRLLIDCFHNYSLYLKLELATLYSSCQQSKNPDPIHKCVHTITQTNHRNVELAVVLKDYSLTLETLRKAGEMGRFHSNPKHYGVVSFPIVQSYLYTCNCMLVLIL